MKESNLKICLQRTLRDQIIEIIATVKIENQFQTTQVLPCLSTFSQKLKIELSVEDTVASANLICLKGVSLLKMPILLCLIRTVTRNLPIWTFIRQTFCKAMEPNFKCKELIRRKSHYEGQVRNFQDKLCLQIKRKIQTQMKIGIIVRLEALKNWTFKGKKAFKKVAQQISFCKSQLMGWPCIRENLLCPRRELPNCRKLICRRCRQKETIPKKLPLQCQYRLKRGRIRR